MNGRNQKSTYKISWLENLKGLHWFQYYNRLIFCHLPCIQFVVCIHTHTHTKEQTSSSCFAYSVSRECV